MVKSSKTAKLLLEGKEYDLPVMSPTAGPEVLDIRKLYGEAGVFTYDPGFTSTASCDSTITFIDGGKGELLHRGHPIDQLAEHSHYLESGLEISRISITLEKAYFYDKEQWPEIIAWYEEKLIGLDVFWDTTGDIVKGLAR